MNLLWFGPPWSSWSSDFTEENHRNTPAGEPCVHCNAMITERDRGVITSCSGRVWGGFDLDFDGDRMRVCGYHLSCWLGLVVGGELSHEVLARLPDERERTALQGGGVESVGDVGGWRDDVDGQDDTDPVEDTD